MDPMLPVRGVALPLHGAGVDPDFFGSHVTGIIFELHGLAFVNEYLRSFIGR